MKSVKITSSLNFYVFFKRTFLSVLKKDSESAFILVQLNYSQIVNEGPPQKKGCERQSRFYRSAVCK